MEPRKMESRLLTCFSTETSSRENMSVEVRDAKEVTEKTHSTFRSWSGL